MQRVVWNAALAHVRDDLIASPIEERIYFDELITVLDRSGDCRRAVTGLLCTQPGNPPRSASQSASERLDLARCAASMSGLYRSPKTVYSVACNQRFEIRVMGVQASYAAAVLPLGLGPQIVRLGKKTAGIERDDFDLESLSEDGIRDSLVFDAEAGGKDYLSADFATQRRKAFSETEPWE